MTRIVTVSMSDDMAKEIDYRCQGRRGRSEWIRDAIQSKINGNPDGDPTIVDAPTRQLMAALHARDDCNERLRAMIYVIMTESGTTSTGNR